MQKGHDLMFQKQLFAWTGGPLSGLRLVLQVRRASGMPFLVGAGLLTCPSSEHPKLLLFSCFVYVILFVSPQMSLNDISLAEGRSGRRCTHLPHLKNI